MVIGRVDVIGLGPGGVDLLTAATAELIEVIRPQYLRTARHPAAVAMTDASSFDGYYEAAESFDALYRSIVADLVDSASEHGRILYAVPGSPVVAERTVQMLLEVDGLDVVIHPAMSFLDLAWAHLGIDPAEIGVSLIDAHAFADTVPSGGGPVLISQCESRITLSGVKLSVDPEPGGHVALLQRLGLPDEEITWLDWSEIDRGPEPDHLTSLYVPDLPARAGGNLDRLASLVSELVDEDPWKAAQDHESLKRFLIEECYEVLEALDHFDAESGDGAEELVSELGDLVYQVVFHSILGQRGGWFELNDVVLAIHRKLSTRRPVVGERSVDESVQHWERVKRVEMERESSFDGIPVELPALLRATRLIHKAEALGLDLPEEGTSAGASLFNEAVAVVRGGGDPENDLRTRLARVEAGLRQAESES